MPPAGIDLLNTQSLRQPYGRVQPNLDPLTRQYQLYNTGVEQQAEDYSGLMKRFNEMYGNIANKGQYSAQQQADIRERGISPIRSVYSSANRDVDRQRALQGGYSPNYGAVKAKMAREMSESLSGATTNVNAQLAQDMMKNQQAMNAQQLSALGGSSSLYGTTPALAKTFGDQALQGAELQHRINQQPLPGRRSPSMGISEPTRPRLR